MHRASTGIQTARRRRCSGFASEIDVRVSYSECKLDERLASLKKVAAKLVLRILCMFHRSDDGSRGGVHGDDFALVGSRRALDRMGKTLSGKYSIPCESRTDLALEVTVNVMPSC